MSRRNPSRRPPPGVRRRGTAAMSSAATRAGHRNASSVSVEMVVDPRRGDAEADPALGLEAVLDEVLCRRRVAGVIAAGHRRDVGLGLILVVDHLDGAGNANPLLAI